LYETLHRKAVTVTPVIPRQDRHPQECEATHSFMAQPYSEKVFLKLDVKNAINRIC